MRRILLAVAAAVVLLTACPAPNPSYPPPPPATLLDTCFVFASAQVGLVFEMTGLGNYRIHRFGPPPWNEPPVNNITGTRLFVTSSLPAALEYEVLPGVWRQVGFAPWAQMDNVCP